MTRLAAALALAAVLLLLPPTPAARADPPSITPSCTSPSGAVSCSGWHTTNVTVSWTVTNFTDMGECTGGTVSFDTTGQSFSCTAFNADGSTTRIVTIRRDATPPTVTGATPSRAADSNGWYSRSFSVAFGGTDATSGIASCTSASYTGPDTAAGVLTGTCTDVAGNTGAAGSLSFRYDGTAPEVTGASLSRTPDSGDWYTKPVTVAFAGADATAGVESCTSAQYSGPDGAAAVTGSCRDRAGNVGAVRTVTFKYDATPPELRSVTARRARGSLLLRWQVSADTAAVQVDRSPGTNGRRLATVFRGKAAAFRDARVVRNRRYRYAVTAVDQAGNRATRTLSVPFPALYLPAAGARVARPPLLAWEADPKATYYNVQLYRGGKKILTLWPARPSLRLTRTWTFAGARQRLGPGVYRWYVWPGYGPRARQAYGKAIGSSRFAVSR